MNEIGLLILIAFPVVFSGLTLAIEYAYERRELLKKVRLGVQALWFGYAVVYLLIFLLG